MSDYRDLVIEMATDSEAELLERVSSLEASLSVSQTLLRAALDAVVALTVERHRLVEESEQVADAYRALREHLLLQAGADDPEDRCA